MTVYSLAINGKTHEVQVDGDTPLLWVLRDEIGLTGTKYGCGIGQCGSCIVHLDGLAVKSCLIPVEQALAKRITTIEGLSQDNSHPLQRAWIEEQVPQCGYCQSGQIMQAAALITTHPDPTEDQINQAMSEVLCRCGTYMRVRKAIARAIGYLSNEQKTGEA